jgi:hypothetical protein
MRSHRQQKAVATQQVPGIAGHVPLHLGKMLESPCDPHSSHAGSAFTLPGKPSLLEERISQGALASNVPLPQMAWAIVTEPCMSSGPRSPIQDTQCDPRNLEQGL